MDKDRQIRFLYPPLIFLGSIALGIWMEDCPALRNQIVTFFFKNTNITSVAVAIIGASSIVLVLGFLIGTVTILLLRCFFVCNRFNYEFKLNEKTYTDIGKLILQNTNESISEKEKMYAAIVFDHSYIASNVHQWVARRWNAFMIASSSVVALISSVIVGLCVGIQISPKWIGPVLVFVTLFTIQGISSWLESMRMIEFMTRVKKEKD